MARTKPVRAALWLALAAALFCLCGQALAEDVDAPYVENAWNYVDGSMDVSAGIPEDASGTLGRIRAAGVLRVATEPYFPPQEYIDPDLEGEARYAGADMDMARRIAERMGVTLEIVPMEFSRVLEAVEEGTCDLAISALAYTPGRAAAVELSKGYYYAGDESGSTLIIRSADAGEITGLDALAGRNIVTQSDSLQELLTAENVQLYREFRRVPSIRAVYEAVQSGAADAAVVDRENARTYIEANPDCGLALVPDVRFVLEAALDGDRVAGRKGELELMYFVNGVVDELLEDGTYRAWFAEHEARARALGL